MTRTSKDERADLALLSRTLDGHGADRDRWPATARLKLARLLAESGEARKMLREAAALDKLLDLAPVVPQERRDALAERIVARAGKLPQASAPGRAVVVNEVRRGLPIGIPPPLLRRVGRIAPAASLLAAALMLGIFTGWSSDMLDGSGTTASPTIETADASMTVELPDVVFGDVAVDSIEEEWL